MVSSTYKRIKQDETYNDAVLRSGNAKSLYSGIDINAEELLLLFGTELNNLTGRQIRAELRKRLNLPEKVHHTKTGWFCKLKDEYGLNKEVTQKEALLLFAERLARR